MRDISKLVADLQGLRLGWDKSNPSNKLLDAAADALVELTEWRPMKDAPDDLILGLRSDGQQNVVLKHDGTFCSDAEYLDEERPHIERYVGWLPLIKASP